MQSVRNTQGKVKSTLRRKFPLDDKFFERTLERFYVHRFVSMVTAFAATSRLPGFVGENEHQAHFLAAPVVFCSGFCGSSIFSFTVLPRQCSVFYFSSLLELVSNMLALG